VETALGIILGAIATVLVSRYYFRRTVSKSIGVFGLLNSFVFAGIASDVRKLLHFRFEDREVDELQQMVFLVANDGERAIRDVIEPLTLRIPPDVEILDASIVHRHPEGLQVEITINSHPPTGSDISLQFPLLNKREFFVVKMLISGTLVSNELSFRILSDDLPRTLKISSIPPGALEDAGFKFEWGLAFAASVVLLFATWTGYSMYLLYGTRPELFPFPWSSFVISVESLALLIPAIIMILLLSLLGLAMMGAAVFGGTFPPAKGPRFPLPKELLSAVFPYRVLDLPGAFTDARHEVREGSNRHIEPRL